MMAPESMGRLRGNRKGSGMNVSETYQVEATDDRRALVAATSRARAEGIEPLRVAIQRAEPLFSYEGGGRSLYTVSVIGTRDEVQE